MLLENVVWIKPTFYDKASPSQFRSYGTADQLMAKLKKKKKKKKIQEFFLFFFVIKKLPSHPQKGLGFMFLGHLVCVKKTFN